MKKILIADDNLQIIDVLKKYALREGYEVCSVTNGCDALNEFEKNTYDAILLDVMMPKKDGFQVCQEIRKKSMIPIIMITARSEDYERIMGLDMGADDYVVKPFSPSEVMARLRAVLRRTGGAEISTEEVIMKGSLRIYPNQCKVFIHKDELSLTKKEVEILQLLVSYEGKVFSRTNILDSVWGYDYVGDTRTIDTHIKRLRAKIEKYSHPDWAVTTVRGFGYKFEVFYE